MILTNRLFERRLPSREAKSIYIFCEGVKREYQYFQYFKEIDSRINVEIYKLHPHEDNSPLGLLKIAKLCIVASKTNPKPKYSFQNNDEVWIILDTDKDHTDSRKPQIARIIKACKETTDWFLAQSNPCFEVWLYYHFLKDKPTIDGIDICANWKQLVNDSISGGFDSRKHPIFMEKAVINSEKVFESQDGFPLIGSTEVFKLSKNILNLVKDKIDLIKQEIVKNNKTMIF